MKYKIYFTSAFKKDAKSLTANERSKTIEIINRLADGEILEPKYCDHQLTGKLKAYRDCHIKPDLVLIYKIEKDILQFSAFRIGTHSKLFGK